MFQVSNSSVTSIGTDNANKRLAAFNRIFFLAEKHKVLELRIILRRLLLFQELKKH